MLTVPRLLWELGTRDLVFTEVGSVGVVRLNDPPFFLLNHFPPSAAPLVLGPSFPAEEECDGHTGWFWLLLNT